MWKKLSSVSHDPSEIILICWCAAQDTFLFIIKVENSYADKDFCGIFFSRKKLFILHVHFL